MPRALDPVIKATQDAGKARPAGPRYGTDQWKDWVNVSQPDAFLISVTRSSFPQSMEIAKALHAEAVRRGMAWKSAASGYARTDDERGIHLVHGGHSFAIKIVEGYRQAKYPEPYVGSGTVRVQVNGSHRWEPGKRKGSVLEQVPLILDWVETTVVEREAAARERARLDEEWERYRDQAAKKRIEKWREGQTAQVALAQAHAWRNADLLREYAEALREAGAGSAESLEWAELIESLAQRTNPLNGRATPGPPAIPDPGYAVLQEVLAGLPHARPWQWQPPK